MCKYFSQEEAKRVPSSVLDHAKPPSSHHDGRLYESLLDEMSGAN